MPRLSHGLIWRSHAISSRLARIVPVCRDINSARNELRWLKEHAIETTKNQGQYKKTAPGWRTVLHSLCEKRRRGVPLQYLIGSEYFGDLEIICKPGVLIPRKETASIVTYLANRVIAAIKAGTSQAKHLRVLDLCTGTGCIPLLFAHLLQQARTPVTLQGLGLDVSESALRLAISNLRRFPRLADQVDFAKADVLDRYGDTGRTNGVPSAMDVLRSRRQQTWDILISNPPYISPKAFRTTTARSVKKYEPQLALVPTSTPNGSRASKEMHWIDDIQQGDFFYPRLFSIVQAIDAKALLFEVADMEQALRVAELARSHDFSMSNIEIWRDQPELPSRHVVGRNPGCDPVAHSDDNSGHGTYQIRGQGHGRAVCCWRPDGADLMKEIDRG